MINAIVEDVTAKNPRAADLFACRRSRAKVIEVTGTRSGWVNLELEEPRYSGRCRCFEAAKDARTLRSSRPSPEGGLRKR